MPDDPEQGGTGNGDGDGDGGDGGDAELQGLDERGQRAVREARAEAARSRRELRAAQQVADEQRAELERLRVQQESEQERAIREAVDAAVTEERGRWQGQLLEARVTARAAGQLRDPSDAPRYLRLDELADADDRQLDEAITTLLADKPYLALANGDGGHPASGSQLVTQGTRSGAPRGTDTTSADAWIRGKRRK